MKSSLKVAAIVALLFTFVSTPHSKARAEDKWERPGADDQAKVDKANTVLDGLYRKLMSKAEDPQEQTSLKEAQRAWLKWRDAEANYIARREAVGGSGRRVAYSEAELKLINERIEMLKKYASSTPED